jgi:CheY-like chemotaxis protein
VAPPRLWREPDWQQVTSGIECKLLATDSQRAHVSMLVRLAPNLRRARVERNRLHLCPDHQHAGPFEMSAHRIPYGLLAAEDRMTQSLGGKAVLVVEDEIIIGMMICTEIVRAGGAAVGPVNSAAGAVKEIESRTIDAVILDAKLADGDATDLAARLAAGRTPFVVISGYEQASLPSSLKGAPFIAKPISVPLLVEAIERLAI